LRKKGGEWFLGKKVTLTDREGGPKIPKGTEWGEGRG